MTQLMNTQKAVDPQWLQRSRWMPNAPLVHTPPPSGMLLHSTPSVQHAGSAFDVLQQQISGSLQSIWHSELPRSLPHIDPYEPPQARQSVVFTSFLAPDFRIEHSHQLEQFERALEATVNSAAVVTPTIVAEFVGRVESLIGDSANVILVNAQTGERLESQCDAEVLRENSIGAGDEFRCEVVRSKGGTSTRLSLMPPKTLSKERVQQIRASFKDRWQF